jgi:AAA+ ATPase superfamily predicted ATPase
MNGGGMTNPFSFGDLALDDAFADREAEVEELVADMRNGQNVLVYAPRRYGKSSLVWRAAAKAVAADVLVGYVDLMRTPTKERLAAALAKTVYEDLASRREQLADQVARLFGGLRVRPVVELDPETGTPRFTFDASRRKRTGDIDETIERLLELPQRVAGERRRRVALVLDEFQEVVKLDKGFPNLMRAVFQTQPEVGHVYLGSKRHVLDGIFNDRNEPFWRSAKRLELGTIPTAAFTRFIVGRFEGTDKGITAGALDRIAAAAGGHPYATQELCYFVWGLVPVGRHATGEDVEEALVQVLRSEHNHFSRVWDDATEHERLLMLALAAEPTPGLYTADWQKRHDLASSTHVQRAASALVREEIVGRNEDGEYALVEPFLAEWLDREQADSPVVEQLRRTRGEA